jgi:hypothetical protein
MTDRPESDPGPKTPLQADALTIAETVLLKLGNAIPDPTTQDSLHSKFYACLIGIRAK